MPNLIFHSKKTKQPNERLWLAALTGDSECARLAIAQGAEIEGEVPESFAKSYYPFYYNQSTTALVLAAICGHANVILELHKAGANFSKCDHYGRGILPLVLLSRKKKAIHTLISIHEQDGLSYPNHSDPHNKSWLYACSTYNHNIIEKLLELGADPMAQNSAGYRAIDAVIRSGSVKKAEVFKAKAPHTIQSTQRNSLVCLAERSGSSAMLCWCHQQGMNLNETQGTGTGEKNALLQSSQRKKSQLSLLLELGADPGGVRISLDPTLDLPEATRFLQHFSPLFWAIDLGFKDHVDALLSFGSHSNHVNEIHLPNTAYHAAILSKAPLNDILDILYILSQHELNPNVLNPQKLTPMMLALNRSSPEILKTLLALGANPHAMDSTTRSSVIETYCLSDDGRLRDPSTPILQILSEVGVVPTEKIEACVQRHEILKLPTTQNQAYLINWVRSNHERKKLQNIDYTPTLNVKKSKFL